MALATISEAITVMGAMVLGSTCVKMMRGVDWPITHRRLHEFALTQAQHLPAHQPRHRRPGDDGDGEHDGIERGLQDRDDDDGEGEGGNRLEELGEAHQRIVDDPAEIAGQRADRHADEAARSTVETRPISSETRAPCMTPDATSRPSASVPSQKPSSAIGGRKGRVTIRQGEAGIEAGRKDRQPAITRARMIRPTSAPWLRAKRLKKLIAPPRSRGSATR